MINGVPHARAGEAGAIPFRLGPAPMSVYTSWDARPGDPGWESVVTVAGSSFCDLGFRDGAGEISTDHHRARPVYRNPRFVREQGARWRATAVSLDSDDVLVLLERGADGRLSCRELMKTDGLQEAVILRSGEGFVLFHTRYFGGSVPPDEAGRIPHRTLWVHESVHPSTPLCIPMEDSLAPAAPAFRPFGDVLVFQMDAAPLGDGRMALFVTTVDGFRIAIGRVRSGSFEGWVDEKLLPGSELTSPTLMADGSTLHLAAIASRGGVRSILRAQLRV